MGGQALRLGPFIGGLNTSSDPTTIADAELAELTNFELNNDGSLISRPPFKQLAGPGDSTERVNILCEAVFPSGSYLIVSNTNGIYHWLNGTWTFVTSVQCYAAVQYADFVYLIPEPNSALPGGKWSPTGGFVAVAAIPQGMAAIIHKERLFVAPGRLTTTQGSRLKFSDPSNPEVFGASSFVDVQPGDGQNLIDLTTFQDNLILFKNNSTYVFPFDVRPSDGVLRRISQTIGASRQNSVANYENQIYVLHEESVYEIINYDFRKINDKVPFVRDATAPSAFADEHTFLSLLDDRLVCRLLNRIYVYGLRTSTWSEWRSSEDLLHYFGPITLLRASTGRRYFAGCCITAYTHLVELAADHSASFKEEIITTEQAVANITSPDRVSFRTTNADAADINIGDFVKLFTSGIILKQDRLFTVTAKVVSGANTTVSFTPEANNAVANTDIIRVVPVITCTAKTKNFDMAISHQFKRLWWWGADVTTNNDIWGIATPIILSFSVTWAQISGFLWNQLSTWAQPLTEATSVSSMVTTNTGTSRRFAKFLKGLRYRQINFKVVLITDGSTSDGPAQLFTMTIHTESKQVISKAVS
jgi:hypothetical protein